MAPDIRCGAAALFVGCLLSMSVGRAQPPPTTRHHTIVAAAAVQWKALRPGAEMAVISGDPAVAGSPFVIRFRYSTKSRIPPHWHPVDEHLTVLSGTFRIGIGEDGAERRPPPSVAARTRCCRQGWCTTRGPMGTPSFKRMHRAIRDQLRQSGRRSRKETPVKLLPVPASPGGTTACREGPPQPWSTTEGAKLRAQCMTTSARTAATQSFVGHGLARTPAWEALASPFESTATKMDDWCRRAESKGHFDEAGSNAS